MQNLRELLAIDPTAWGRAMRGRKRGLASKRAAILRGESPGARGRASFMARIIAQRAAKGTRTPKPTPTTTSPAASHQGEV